MSKQKELIKKIHRATLLMQSGIENSDIDLIEEMINERDVLLTLYSEMESLELDDSDNEMIEEFLLIDKSNNVKFSKLIEDKKISAMKFKKEKADVKKKNIATKRYLTAGQNSGLHSKFNIKT